LAGSDTLATVVGGGGAWLPCRNGSDINLFGYSEGVVDLDAEIAHRALDLPMPQQKLDRP
jgi:hypothetical protein